MTGTHTYRDVLVAARTRCAPANYICYCTQKKPIMTTVPAGATNAAIPRPPTDPYQWNPPSEVQQKLVQAAGADGNGKPADPYRYNIPSDTSDDKVTDSAVPQPQEAEPESPAVLVVPAIVTPVAPTKARQEEEKEEEDEDDSDYVPSEEDDDEDDDDETDMEGSDSDPEETLQEKLAVIDSADDEEEEDA